MSELHPVADLVHRLRSGRAPQTQLVDTVHTLFKEDTFRYAYERLRDQDAFRGGLSGDYATDIWRTLRDAYIEVGKGRPLAAWKRLEAVAPLHPTGSGLPEIERLWLSAQLAMELNQVPAAVRFCEEASTELEAFTRLIQQSSAQAAEQVKTLFKVLANITNLRDDIPETTFLDGWLLGRGSDILIRIASTLSNLYRTAQDSEAARSAAARGETTLLRFHDVVGLGFDPPQIASMMMALGDAWTELDDRRAYDCFATTVQIWGIERGVYAAVNAANALFGLGEYEEAEALYRQCESLLEHAGRPQEAARVWVYENMANWNYRHNPDIRYSLVGALQFYEENLPKSTDVMTRYSQKKYIESGYQLLITVIAASEDRSEARLDELLGALWAVSSRDLLARLKDEAPADAQPLDWQALLDRELQPLRTMRNALRPFPGFLVLHLTPGINSLLWIAYGYDAQGAFQFEISMGGQSQADLMNAFLNAFYEQQEADLIDDALRVASLNARLAELGDQIGAELSPALVRLLRSASHIAYMPNPSGNVAEFPLTGIRLEAKWLGEYATITRAPTVNYLRELLSANRAMTIGNARAAVVLGDPESGGPALQRAREHADWVESAWQNVYQFKPKVEENASRDALRGWMDGEVGIIHYVGHGFSNVVSEGLPLAGGETFTISTVDKLTGAKMPFVFICACEAARIRYGRGGYQAGIASKLTERSAPAVLAFSVPIPESRAYAIAQRFYREAVSAPIGQAVQQTQRVMAAEVPAYAWMAFTAYGDPAFRLPEMRDEGQWVTSTPKLAVTWHSALRNHAVLRTEASKLAAEQKLADCPEMLREADATLLHSAFTDAPVLSAAQLDTLETELLSLASDFPVEALSLHAVICLERAHQVGLDSNHIRIPEAPEDVRELMENLGFVAYLGAALFDMRVNGIGHMLVGRLVTVDRSSSDYSRMYLEQGAEKLTECAPFSPFAERMRAEAFQLLRMFPRYPRS